MARFPDWAPRLLERFLQCDVLAESGVPGISMPR